MAKVKKEQVPGESQELVLVKIKVLVSLAGKFLLPYDPGAEVEIESNQAEAIVEAGYGEFV